MARLKQNMHTSLNEEVLKILFSKKIYTVVDFIDAEIKYVTNITPLAYKDVIEIREIITNTFSAKVLNGADLYANLQRNSSILKTNIESLDTLLNGGFQVGNIYELCGFASSGKTQLCLTIAANMTQYFEKSVLYIDTKRDFSGKRLQQILDTRNCTEELSAKILNQIKVKQITNQYQLINILHDLKTNNSTITDIKLIILDSLPAIFYQTGDFNTTLIYMNHFVNILRYLTVQHNICFIIVNIMLKNQNLSLKDGQISTEKPGLGKYWQSVPHVRLALTKNDDCCKITVVKSTNLPTNINCIVKITDGGVI